MSEDGAADDWPKLFVMSLMVFIPSSLFESGCLRLHSAFASFNCDKLRLNGIWRRAMKWFLKLLMLCLGLAVSASGQTAHDYFNELKAANTFNHYRDEYVCFADEDVPSFAIIAKVSDVVEQKKKVGETGGIKPPDATYFVSTSMKRAERFPPARVLVDAN